MIRKFANSQGRPFQSFASSRPYGRYIIVVDEDIGSVTAMYVREGPNSETYGEARPMKLSAKSALGYAWALRWIEIVPIEANTA